MQHVLSLNMSKFPSLVFLSLQNSGHASSDCRGLQVGGFCSFSERLKHSRTKCIWNNFTGKNTTENPGDFASALAAQRPLSSYVTVSEAKRTKWLSKNKEHCLIQT